MKLALDFGNTSLKFALFEGSEMITFDRYAEDDLQSLEKRILATEFEAGIISSVIHVPDGFVSRIAGDKPFYRLDHRSVLPFNLNYNTPQSLGPDRIAAAAGASAMHPDKAVLVIVSGTCITFDLVTPDQGYLGGAISPGLNMRLQAMHTFTDKLPLIPLTNEYGLIGKSTEESILSGAVNGAIAEVFGIIDRYRESWPDLQVILSGGNLPVFAKYQKNSIFAVPEIVLKGLNEILETNLRDED